MIHLSSATHASNSRTSTRIGNKEKLHPEPQLEYSWCLVLPSRISFVESPLPKTTSVFPPDFTDYAQVLSKESAPPPINPLIPSTLEQLQSASLFTKLDLRSAYRLIHIHEGNKWNTAFITRTGSIEYLVMPYILANSPSIFQSFINEIFLWHAI